MYIVCLMMVTLVTGNGHKVDTMRELYGKLISQTSSSVVGDFSGYAQMKEYIGDYSQVLVPKSNCSKDD